MLEARQNSGITESLWRRFIELYKLLVPSKQRISAPDGSPAASRPLSSAPPGVGLKILEITESPSKPLLLERGFVPGTSIMILQLDDQKMIVALTGHRVGIPLELANQIVTTQA